jgi:hypothetical protein
MDEAARLLFLMIAGHAYADFGLQTPWHSAAKRPGNSTGIPWFVGLAMHSLIHGGIVALVTGLWWLGAAEALAHAGIDAGKGRGCYGAITDQILHFACKIIWVIIAISY